MFTPRCLNGSCTGPVAPHQPAPDPHPTGVQAQGCDASRAGEISGSELRIMRVTLFIETTYRTIEPALQGADVTRPYAAGSDEIPDPGQFLPKPYFGIVLTHSLTERMQAPRGSYREVLATARDDQAGSHSACRSACSMAVRTSSTQVDCSMPRRTIRRSFAGAFVCTANRTKTRIPGNTSTRHLRTSSRRYRPLSSIPLRRRLTPRRSRCGRAFQ